MKFIGHLDIMRYFQKALRRAGIDIAYSEGFSPHQIMSFAAPLGVGVISDGEYLDIEVHSTRSSQESIYALNQVMVEGITVLEYKKLPDMAKTSMSLVVAADYLLYWKEGYEIPFTLEALKDSLNRFYCQREILITKKTKKSETVMDLKPLIYDMKVQCLEDKGFGIFLKVCTGSSSNVKPELVLESFFSFCGLSWQPLAIQIQRLEVYASFHEIPVKGEKEREAYQKQLEQRKKDLRETGGTVPDFVTLGELGEDIL